MARRAGRRESAYPCWCTPARLAAVREAARGGEAPVWLLPALPAPDWRAEREASGEPFTIRLPMPDDDTTVVTDLVRGEVRFENALLGDHVVVRASGVPTTS